MIHIWLYDNSTIVWLLCSRHKKAIYTLLLGDFVRRWRNVHSNFPLIFVLIFLKMFPNSLKLSVMHCWLISLQLTELELNIANWTKSIEKGMAVRSWSLSSVSRFLVPRFATLTLDAGPPSESGASLTANQGVAGSSPGPATFFHLDLVMKKITTTILTLPLIQQGQWSVTGKSWALSTGKLPRRLAQNQCG